MQHPDNTAIHNAIDLAHKYLDTQAEDLTPAEELLEASKAYHAKPDDNNYKALVNLGAKVEKILQPS